MPCWAARCSRRGTPPSTPKIWWEGKQIGCTSVDGVSSTRKRSFHTSHTLYVWFDCFLRLCFLLIEYSVAKSETYFPTDLHTTALPLKACVANLSGPYAACALKQKLCSHQDDGPPGRPIYAKTPYSVYEVDGEEHKVSHRFTCITISFITSIMLTWRGLSITSCSHRIYHYSRSCS